MGGWNPQHSERQVFGAMAYIKYLHSIAIRCCQKVHELKNILDFGKLIESEDDSWQTKHNQWELEMHCAITPIVYEYLRSSGSLTTVSTFSSSDSVATKNQEISLIPTSFIFSTPNEYVRSLTTGIIHALPFWFYLRQVDEWPQGIIEVHTLAADKRNAHEKLHERKHYHRMRLHKK